MPAFYELQNEDKILPEISIHFHPSVFLYFVIFPTVAFGVLAICYAWYKLKSPVFMLLKDCLQVRRKVKKYKESPNENQSFLKDLKKNTVKRKKSLSFFVFFASFCFSAMTQMSFHMKDLSSAMMGIMILLIGLVLALTILFLAIAAVINGNRKTIAMMKVFGYSQKKCCKAILSGYRPISYIGLILGTVYQYILLRLMVDIVFRDIAGVPVYRFDFPVMFASFAVFIIVYEVVMYAYSEKIKKISVKEIMIES